MAKNLSPHIAPVAPVLRQLPGYWCNMRASESRVDECKTEAGGINLIDLVICVQDVRAEQQGRHLLVIADCQYRLHKTLRSEALINTTCWEVLQENRPIVSRSRVFVSTRAVAALSLRAFRRLGGRIVP